MFNRVKQSSLAAVLIALFFGGVLSTSTLSAQVGTDTKLWEFIEDAAHHKAIVEIGSGNGIGTGVIVHVNLNKPVADGFEGYCLTAYHVVQNDNGRREITVTYQNGRRARQCKVEAYDESNDIALVWVWVPADISPASIAHEPIRRGEYLEISGLGGGSELKCCIRHFKTEATFPTSKETIFANVPLLPGDSGGPGFNAHHEVVGIVSGGWFWIDGEVKDNNGRELQATWPARLSNTAPIHDLMARLD